MDPQRLRLVPPARQETRAHERRRLRVPGQLVWKDSRGTTRLARIVTRDVSAYGVSVDCLDTGCIPLYRLVYVWQEELRAALHQWQGHSKDEDALLRGAPLAQSEVWYAERGTEIGSAEKEFIQASLQLRQRRDMEREAQRQHERAAERRARRLSPRQR